MVGLSRITVRPELILMLELDRDKPVTVATVEEPLRSVEAAVVTEALAEVEALVPGATMEAVPALS